MIDACAIMIDGFNLVFVLRAGLVFPILAARLSSRLQPLALLLRE